MNLWLDDLVVYLPASSSSTDMKEKKTASKNSFHLIFAMIHSTTILHLQINIGPGVSFKFLFLSSYDWKIDAAFYLHIDEHYCKSLQTQTYKYKKK